MKITFIIRSLGFGGAERVISELSNNLVKEDEISIITFNSAVEEYELNEKVKRINLNFTMSKKQVFCEIYLLRKVCIDLDSDFYIAFDTFANLYSIMALIGMHKRIAISERNAVKEPKYRLYTRLLRKLLYRCPNFYIFQTKQAACCYSKKIQKKSYIIPNPVKDNLPIKRYVDDQKKIVTVGRLVYQKNYELLIDAFAEFSVLYPEYTLEIWGEGKEQESLQKQCIQKNILNKVFFMGNCKNVHEKILDAEIFVMTSRFEGMPNALLEAMAMGFPVISTNCPVGGPEEMIENGKNGILLSRNNVDELVSAFSFFASNRESAINCGIRAQDVRNEYHLEKIKKKWKMMFMLEMDRGHSK